MSAPTATLTTTVKKKNGTAVLRMKPETAAPKEAVAPPSAGTETDFFWTYTEEPHRTRRMAIIKAHPEVCSLPCGDCNSLNLEKGH